MNIVIKWIPSPHSWGTLSPVLGSLCRFIFKMATTSDNQTMFSSESDNDTQVTKHEDSARAVSSLPLGKEEKIRMKRGQDETSGGIARFCSKMGDLPQWKVGESHLVGKTLNYSIGFIASCMKPHFPSIPHN
jgi:hypothetical protein